MKKIVLLCVHFALFAQFTNAQLAHTIMKTIEAKDVQDITLSITDASIKIEKYASNFVLVEMKIEIENGTQPMLNYMIAHKRYELEIDSNSIKSGSLILKTKDRLEIRANKQKIQEKVTLILRIPDNFEQLDATHFTRGILAKNKAFF